MEGTVTVIYNGTMSVWETVHDLCTYTNVAEVHVQYTMGSLDLRSKVMGETTPTIHDSRNSELVKVNPMNSS